jgi:hypothetical protein
VVTFEEKDGSSRPSRTSAVRPATAEKAAASRGRPVRSLAEQLTAERDEAAARQHSAAVDVNLLLEGCVGQLVLAARRHFHRSSFCTRAGAGPGPGLRCSRHAYSPCASQHEAGHSLIAAVHPCTSGDLRMMQNTIHTRPSPERSADGLLWAVQPRSKVNSTTSRCTACLLSGASTGPAE